jgi:hypothetical protein
MSFGSPLELAPGIYFVTLALVLAGVLRRWYDPLPARAGAAFAVALALLFGSSLFGGQVLLPLDNLRGEVPFRQLPATHPTGNLLQGDLIELVTPSLAAAHRSLEAGRWPLWSFLFGAGMPLLADPQAQALSPLALLAQPFSPVRGAAVVAALRVYLALVFTYLLLRRQGLGEWPSLTGALAFGLSGFVLLWVGWPLASAAALLPAVLYALARLAGAGEPGRGMPSALPDGDRPGPPSAGSPTAPGCLPSWRRDALLLGLALAALLVAGHPETELYAGLLAAAFAASLVRRRPRGRRLALAGRMGGAALVAAGLAAPALLPALDYLPQTLRAERLAHPAPPRELAPDADGDLARRWLPIVAPNAYGNSRFAAYWGLSNTNEDASGFAGTVAVLGAALAIAVRRRHRLPQEGLMLAVLGLCLLQLADPRWWHAPLAAALPALAGSRRCLVLVAFCLAYLAACTCERWRRGELARAPLFAAVLALAALIAWAYLSHECPGDPGRLAVLRFGWLRWQARFLAGATVLLALPGGQVRQGAPTRNGALARPVAPARQTAPTRQAAPGARWGRLLTGRTGRVLATLHERIPGTRGSRVLGAAAAAGLALLVGAELLLAHLPANPPMPMSLAFPAPPPVATIAGELEAYRVAALGRALLPNIAAMYGMNDARVYNPMAPAAYLALLRPIIAAWWGELPELGNPGHPLYRELSVRYLLVAPGERLAPPWRLRLADPSGWVYRLDDPWPRLYATVRAGGEPLPGGLRLAIVEDEWIVARARTDGRGEMLAGSVYQDGCWRLLAEGRRAPPPPAGRLLAVPLPAARLPVAQPAAAQLPAAQLPAARRPASRPLTAALPGAPPVATSLAGDEARVRGPARPAGAGELRLDLLYRPRGFIAGLLAAAVAVAVAIALWSPRPTLPAPCLPAEGTTMGP